MMDDRYKMKLDLTWFPTWVVKRGPETVSAIYYSITNAVLPSSAIFKMTAGFSDCNSV